MSLEGVDPKHLRSDGALEGGWPPAAIAAHEQGRSCLVALAGHTNMCERRQRALAGHLDEHPLARDAGHLGDDLVNVARFDVLEQTGRHDGVADAAWEGDHFGAAHLEAFVQQALRVQLVLGVLVALPRRADGGWRNVDAGCGVLERPQRLDAKADAAPEVEDRMDVCLFLTTGGAQASEKGSVVHRVLAVPVHRLVDL